MDAVFAAQPPSHPAQQLQQQLAWGRPFVAHVAAAAIIKCTYVAAAAIIKRTRASLHG